MCSIPTLLLFLNFFRRSASLPPLFVLSLLLVAYGESLSVFGRMTQNTNTHKPPESSSAKMKLVYNIGGISHAHEAQRIQDRTLKHRSYTHGKKLKLLQRFDALVEQESVPINIASTTLGISLASISGWRNQKEALSSAISKDKLSLHKGPASILWEVEEELMAYIHLWHQKGFPVSRLLLVWKVGQLRTEFAKKTLAARKMVVSRFLARNQLTHRVATHKAQRCPGEVRNEALAHLEVQVPQVNDSCRHQDFIMNMDQTPVYQAMDKGRTIDVVGAWFVNLRTLANNSQRITVAMMITALGKQLKSCIVFKGE